MAVVVGLTISTVTGSFIMFVLYLRPVLKAAEKASTAAEKAALEMETAAKVRCRSSCCDCRRKARPLSQGLSCHRLHPPCTVRSGC